MLDDRQSVHYRVSKLALYTARNIIVHHENMHI